jgi:truncated hemoglobin YjbI
MQLIENVVVAFYKKATTDILIGYHFRKIQESKSSDPLYPELNHFSEHIPRIITFWRQQLVLLLDDEKPTQFDLLNVHRKLNIRRGELNRWVLLFKETLREIKNQISDESEIKILEKLETKIDHFEGIFLKQLF